MSDLTTPVSFTDTKATAYTLATQPLRLNDFSVSRGEVILCQGINVNVNAGEVYHIIGANGTGKTTLLMQLSGLLPFNPKQANWANVTPKQWRLMYIAHQLGIHPSLTVAQNLKFLLALYAICPTAETLATALDWVGLTGYEQEYCYRLSAGQQRRVMLARLYFAKHHAQQVPLWLLDEPFTALDTHMVTALEDNINQFCALGGRVLMTSHQTTQLATQTLNLGQYVV